MDLIFPSVLNQPINFWIKTCNFLNINSFSKTRKSYSLVFPCRLDALNTSYFKTWLSFALTLFFVLAVFLSLLDTPLISLKTKHGSENRTTHIKAKSLKDGCANRPIERYHNEIRENVKTRRGLGNDESAQIFSDFLKINHNFVKPHQGLDGKTPAQKAGIDLELGVDKYLDLIKLSGTRPNFVNNLGKRINKVSIVNEGDCIKVSTRGWIDKHIWREINDILSLHKFSWLSNGKDSCWLRIDS